MKPLLALLILAFAVVSSSQTGPGTAQQERRIAFWAKIGNTYDATWRAAARLKAGRPVDDLQADLLAHAYFYKYVNGCGGLDRAVDKGAYWRFGSSVGYAGVPGPALRVEKATGVTSSKGLPTVKDPKVYSVPVRKGKH